MGVTHGQGQDLGICTWRVRLSQQEPKPHHSVRIPGETPGLRRCGEEYSHRVRGVDGVFSLQHAGLWLLHCGSELSFNQVLSWSQLTPSWRWLVGRCPPFLPSLPTWGCILLFSWGMFWFGSVFQPHTLISETCRFAALKRCGLISRVAV